MNEKELAALQPTVQTGPEIRAALARIVGAKTSAQSRTRDAQAELDERARDGTLTSAHRRKLEDVIYDQGQHVVLLDALATKVTEPLANIELVEKNERLGSERIALKSELAEQEATFEAEYPPLHAALDKLLTKRRDLAARVHRHNNAASAIFPPLDLRAFRLPDAEISLLLTPEERAEASITPYQREMMAQVVMDEARRQGGAARSPIVVNDAPLKPFVTVAGVVQHSGSHTW